MNRKKKSSQTKRIIVESNININDKYLMEVVTSSMGKINLQIEDIILRKCGQMVDKIMNQPEFLEWIKSEAVTAALVSRVYNLDEETERKRILDAVRQVLSGEINIKMS